MTQPIYLDYHATTPVDRRVLDVMWPYFSEKFGNPSSASHAYGWTAEAAVQVARNQVALLLGCRPFEVIFTGGATESNNTVLMGVADVLKSRGRHLVTTAFEHKSVLSPCALLEKQGFEVTYLKPDRSGQVSVDAFEKALRPDTVLASMIWANNEVGSILPIEKMAKVARKKGVLFHTDATQATQYLEISFGSSEIDFLTISAHKMYGPKGVGALVVRCEPDRAPFSPLLCGGGQENGLRGGTLNVPGIVGLGKAAELAKAERVESQKHVLALRSLLWERLVAGIPGIRLHGSFEQRLPNNLNFHVEGVESSLFVNRVADRLAISTGSACLGGAAAGSHVLSSMGYSPQEMAGAIRVGLGRLNTEEEVLQAAEIFIRAAAV